jgi:hypothetical protein
VGLNVPRVAESTDDSLLLLLAVDRIRHSSRQAAAITDDHKFEVWHANGVESEILIDEQLVLALEEMTTGARPDSRPGAMSVNR